MSGAGCPVPERCVPGLRYGPLPERRERMPMRGALESLVEQAIEGLCAPRRNQRVERDSSALDALIANLESRPDDPTGSVPRTGWSAAGPGGRSSAKARDRGDVIGSLAQACVVAQRTLGLMPHQGQRRTAAAMLEGFFVELPTGEGKTLASALAAAVIAADGTPVHVLTANDYLAERDATLLAPFYAALGLSSAWVLPAMDEGSKRAAYACDVVHLTGKQAGFDWMRDRLALGPETHALVTQLAPLTRSTGQPREAPLQRGLCAAILDEADSLLLDEARTPLVLAAPLPSGEADERQAGIALGLAQLLERERDFQLKGNARNPVLTRVGAARLDELARRVPGVWRAARYRDERVRQALVALHVLQLDQDYVVRDGKVMLVDEQSGRALPDRRLPHGLHALLEVKERCPATTENRTVASIAFQSFLQRYLRLVGTSGTLSEARTELRRVYGARLVHVGPARPLELVKLPSRVFASRAEQLAALVAEVREALVDERPVLIATRSVEQSRAVSATLKAHGLTHRLLNAVQDADEASIVAEAGRAGRVTVATNMAGRGTDIPLGPGVAAKGGLHLVSLAFNDARRIDRQLVGRTARQGEPGSFRQLWTLDDEKLVEALPAGVRAIARGWLGSTDRSRVARVLLPAIVRLAQHLYERRYSAQRRQASAARQRIDRHVAVSGNADHPA